MWLALVFWFARGPVTHESIFGFFLLTFMVAGLAEATVLLVQLG